MADTPNKPVTSKPSAPDSQRASEKGSRRQNGGRPDRASNKPDVNNPDDLTELGGGAAGQAQKSDAPRHPAKNKVGTGGPPKAIPRRWPEPTD